MGHVNEHSDSDCHIDLHTIEILLGSTDGSMEISANRRSQLTVRAASDARLK